MVLLSLYSEIPVPDDARLRESYLELGWEELKPTAFRVAMLTWPRDRGAPIHPHEGLVAASRARDIDALLGWQLVATMVGQLPDANEHDEDFREVKVEVTLCFERESRRQRHKSAAGWQSWEIRNARVELPQKG